MCAMAIASRFWSRGILISGQYMSLELLPSPDKRVVALPTGHQREASALELTLRALQPYLSRSDVTEVCINQPGHAFLEARAGGQGERLPFAGVEWGRGL